MLKNNLNWRLNYTVKVIKELVENCYYALPAKIFYVRAPAMFQKFFTIQRDYPVFQYRKTEINSCEVKRTIELM